MIRKFSTHLLTLAVVFTLTGFAAGLEIARAEDSAPLKVVGIWNTESPGASVEIKEAGDGTLIGIIASASDPTKKDENNPDPALRDRPVLGLQILSGFKPDNSEKTEWSGGKIYDPKNGKTYSCKMKLDGESLRIRGYIGIPLLGRTAVWNRAAAQP